MSVSVEKQSANPGALSGYWRKLERSLFQLSDRLNPILVKETRQALKSKQFTITFALVLLACWLWSIVGVAMIGPRIYYSAEAAEMFYGYYLILAFPLAIIIPFAAYRSLASECEDNTYELLSITTLGPRQIIAGKLGSALVQMLVYFSAVTPCLAFTYILRGIDILTIGVLLGYAFFGSLGLSMIGLFLATTTRLRYFQVVITVVLVLGLAYAFAGACAGAWEMLRYGGMYINDDDFWISNALVLTCYVTYFALIFLAAAAQITFPSENRSTALRWAMLVQHVCIGGWMGFAWFYGAPTAAAATLLLMLLGVHWYVMGALMAGESPEISDRVKRGLPQSFLGRSFLTWLNPGPASGYMFVVVNLFAGLLLGLITLALGEIFGVGVNRGRPTAEMAIYAMVLLVSYVTLFLGLGNLLLMLLRKTARVYLFTATVVQILVFLVLSGIPLVIQLMSPVLRNQDYTLLQITSPIWSLGHIMQRGTLPEEADVLIAVVPLMALIVFIANMPAILSEVRHVRIAKPQRLEEEDAELAATEEGPTSPWDN